MNVGKSAFLYQTVWLKCAVQDHDDDGCEVVSCMRTHLTFERVWVLSLSLSSGADFVLHNQRFLSRIYPAGSRTSSSNYNPQEFWNVGSQLGESVWERERERMYACLITGASWYKWSHGFIHICVYSGACYLEWTEQTMLTFTHFVEHFPNLKRQFTLKHAYFSSHLYCYSSILFVLVWAAKFWR